MEKKIPFYSNTPDDTHCFQACLKMLIEYYWPEKIYSWEKMDEITSIVEGLGTWPTLGLMYMQEQGVEVRVIETFNYEKFIKDGGKYLIEEYGTEVGTVAIECGDMEQEITATKKFIEAIDAEKRIPSREDITSLLSEGYLIIVNINFQTINNKTGYIGHFVLIKGFDDNNFIINDPGLPAQENRLVSFELFEKAWAYPNEKAKNIMAFKLS